MPTGADTPATLAASSLVNPRAIASQNGRRAALANTGGRPGDRTLLRVERLDLRLPVFAIVHLAHEVLRRPLESTQYAAGEFRAELTAHGMLASMSRKGDCYDNAVAESFFATLEFELIMQRDWATKEDARRAIFRYIETWYNRKRRHSTLGYISPVEYEAQLQEKAQLREKAQLQEAA